MVGVMAAGRSLTSGVIAAILIAGCGSSHHKEPATTASSSTAAAASRASSGLGARVLTSNELAGFQSARVSHYPSASSWISSEQGLPPGQAAAERAMLSRDGFRGAAREDLMSNGTAGLSLVEQFRSPTAARHA